MTAIGHGISYLNRLKEIGKILVIVPKSQIQTSNAIPWKTVGTNNINEILTRFSDNTGLS